MVNVELKPLMERQRGRSPHQVRNDRMVLDIHNGLSVKEAAERYGLGTAQVYQIYRGYVRRQQEAKALAQANQEGVNG